MKNSNNESQNHIYLKLGKVESTQLTPEAYAQEVHAGSITITANTTHGIFNGLQTLFQLIKNDVYVGR